MIKLKFTKPRLLLILGTSLIFITLISVFNPFRSDLFALDYPAQCFNTCLNITWEDCTSFCYPSPGENCVENSENGGWGYGDANEWCSFISTNEEMCSGGCKAENSTFADYEANCEFTCQMYSTTQGCIDNAEGLIGVDANTSFCSYLDYEQPNGIYFDKVVNGLLEVTETGTYTIDGYIREDTAPITIYINDENTYEESCDFQFVSANIWSFSCPTKEVTTEGSQYYHIYAQDDLGAWDEEYSLSVLYHTNPTYFWNFFGDDITQEWANEKLYRLYGETNGSAPDIVYGFPTSTNPQGLDFADSGYINYDDSGEVFSFDQSDSHFKVEAMVYSTDFTLVGGDKRVIGKYNEEGTENTWLLGIQGNVGDSGGKVYCAVWIDGVQETSIPQDTYLVDSQWNKIGCEWNATTGILTTYLNDTPIGTSNELNGTLASSTNSLTINGRPNGGDGVNTLIDEIKIEIIPPIQIPIPSIISIDNPYIIQEIDISDAEITGTVMDYSEIPSLQMKRADAADIEENWNSCTLTPVVTPAIPIPVAHWSLDETTGVGAFLLDDSGNNLNATPTNTATTTGFISNARSFDGNNAYLEVDPTNQSVLPDGSEPRTVSAWVKLNNYNEEIRQVFHYGETQDNEAWGLAIYNTGAFGVNEWNSNQTKGHVNLNEWTHLAITLDDSGNKTYYQNGQEVGTANNIPNTTLVKSPKIGSNAENSGNFFDGNIDEVYMFASELTPAQIQAVYENDLHNYTYSCYTGPLTDLSTNVFDIKATDASSNSTTTNAYVEADDFGGLTLKSLWRLEDVDNIEDEMGFANNGYYAIAWGKPDLVDGLYGKAFDITWDRRVLVDDPNGNYAFNTDEGFIPHLRVESTAKREVFGNNEQRVLLSKESVGGGDILWKLGVDGSGGVKCVINTLGGKVEVISNETVGSDEWHTLGCDWNASTGVLTALLDGVEVENVTTDIDISQRDFPESSGRVILGGMGQMGGFDPLSGTLDNTKIYYEPQIKPEEAISPEIIIDENSKFQIAHNSGSVVVTGTVSDDSGISSVEIKKVGTDTWNACTQDEDTTPITLPTPLAKWSMEEETGIGAYILDSGDGHYNGTPTQTTFVDGIVGNARQFVSNKIEEYINDEWVDTIKGSNIEIDSSINSVLPSGSEPRTISAWVKLETTRCPYGENPVFSYGSEGATWSLVVSCDHRLSIYDGDGFHRESIDVIVPSWQWTLLTVSLNSSGNQTYYLNGQNIGVRTYTETNTIPIDTPKIGTFFNYNHYFYGEIDEVSIFDRALTDEEVLNIYKDTIDNYGFSCEIQPPYDLNTNIYEIRATDSLNNTTTEGNYSSTIVEADEVNGLDLISLWRLEDKDNIIDEMGLGGNATLSDGGDHIFTVPGLYGNGIWLDWSRRIYIDDTAQAYSFNTDSGLLPHIRFEASAKRQELGNGDQRVLISKETTNQESVLWKLGIDGTGGVKCVINTIGGQVEVISNETVSSDQWHTLGCDWNATTGVLTALLDGIIVESNTTEMTSEQKVFPESTGRLIIGGMGQEGGFDPLDGRIDHVKIYKESLAQSLDFIPFQFVNNSTIISTNTYTIEGTAATIENEVLSIQSRLYQDGQAEGDNWSNCTCDDGTCNSISEDFSCNLTNIPDPTSTYELRLGYGDPIEYIPSSIYGRFDITKDSSNGLITWWGFDSTTEIIDYGTNALDGTITGIGDTSISSDTGSLTNVFDGDTYFEIPDTDKKLNFNGINDEFTVEMDIKPDLGLTTNEEYSFIYKNGENDGPYVWGIKMYVTGEGIYSVRGMVDSNGEKSVGLEDNTDTYLIPGQWNHIVFAYSNLDATTTIRVDNNDTVVYSNGTRFELDSSTAPVTIGSLLSGGNKFKGEIDNIKISNKADTKSPHVEFTPLVNRERVTDIHQEFEITLTDETGVQSFSYLFYPYPTSYNGSLDPTTFAYIFPPISTYFDNSLLAPITNQPWTVVDNPTVGNWGDKEVVVRITAPNTLQDRPWYLYTQSEDTNKFKTILPKVDSMASWYTSVAVTSPSAMAYYYFIVEAEDTTPPEIFAHSIIPSRTVDTNPGVRGYVKDNEKDTISNIALIEYKLEKGTLVGEDWQPDEIGQWLPIIPLGIENVFDQPTEEFYLKLERLQPGDYKLFIRAEDTAGNSTEDNATSHSEYFTIYEMVPGPETTVLVKEEDFNSHMLHDQLFSDGVWGNGILRLRQAIDFQQTTELFTDYNDFGFNSGEAYTTATESIDGNLWVISNDNGFMYYNKTTKVYTRYPSPKSNEQIEEIDEFEFEGNRYLALGYSDYYGLSTVIYDIKNTPENITGDTSVDYETKAGFSDYVSFKFVNTDTRNDKFAFFARAEPAAENFLIWIDTKKTIMDLSDDTYVTWGTADNLFYDEELEEYHTDHDIVSAYFDQETNTFIMGTYYSASAAPGVFICNDGGNPENKTNDTCRFYGDMSAIFSILKDSHGYYWLAGNNGIIRIDTKNTESILDDTLYTIIAREDFKGQDIGKIISIPGEYPVGDEIWYLTTDGYLRGLEYNFTYDDFLDDTNYSYKIDDFDSRSRTSLVADGRNTFYTLIQGKGVQKISLTRSFETLNTIEMLPIPPDGVLSINYIDLEEVLGSVTNGSQYTLNDLVQYEVSNDSGVTWYPITKGNRVQFPTPDYKLKLKIILNSGSSPIIDFIKLSYITYAEQIENSCDIKIESEAPQITTIQANTNKTFTVNYAPLTSPTVNNYTLEYGTSNTSFTSGTVTVQSGTTSFIVNNIEENTEYFFRVKAVSDCTSSLWSEVVSATNTGTPEIIRPPIVPKPIVPGETVNLCGNAVLDDGEECDYANTNTYMCEDGTQAVCTTACTLDTSSCKDNDIKIPIVNDIKEVIKDGEIKDGEGISSAQVANWAVKLVSLTLLTLSAPLIPYYVIRLLTGIMYAIGKKKRSKEYGYVYDSITKEPVKQAIVRIYNGEKLVHTDVTGTYGEFGGNIQPGRYTIIVEKPQYTFPSTRILGTQDLHISNVYNGYLNIEDTKEALVAVPIDNTESKFLDVFKAVVINRSAILLQVLKLLIFIGLLGYSIYAYTINDSLINLLVLIEYAIVLFILLITSLKKNIKYGIVTDSYDQKVSGVNIALFETDFNRLQAERITDEKGRYRFITKPGKYEIKSLTPSYSLAEQTIVTTTEQPSIINSDLKVRNSR